MMTEYRIGKDALLQTLALWDQLIPGRKKIHLIACGGTALTLLGYKPSTKDVDLMVPDSLEYRRLLKFIRDSGYQNVSSYGWKRRGESIIFDLYPGNKIFTTELLTSPLENHGHRAFKTWKKIYLGTLNILDLIISKLFRGDEADMQDCRLLAKYENIDMDALKTRYRETAKYEVHEARVKKNLKLFTDQIR